MELIQSISQDPALGFNRQVNLTVFRWSTREEAITLNLEVEYIFDKKGKDVNRLTNYSVALIANNTTPVNPKTGEFLDTNEDGTLVDPLQDSIGEYDFFTTLAGLGPIDIIGLIKYSIQRADTLGRFDI